MTISSTTNRVSYTGNGVTTAFAFGYKFIANADLAVYQAGTLKTITTHYTVTGAGSDSGGTVTFVTAPANAESVVIVRDPAITQGTDLVENDPLPAETLEDALDKLTIIAQRLDDRLDRSFVLADSSTASVTLTIPTPTANKGLRWNSAGTALENTTDDIDDLATDAAASASAASTSASAAATSASAASTSASNASTSATSASTSASTATTQASNASAAASAVGTQFTFDSSTTMADPGTGDFRLNNATVGSVTAIAVSALTSESGNADVSNYIATWADSTNTTVKGHITIKKSGTPATFATFSISAVTDNGTWLELTVSHVASNGAWSAADVAYIAFNRTGNKGADGAGSGDFLADGSIPMTGNIQMGAGTSVVFEGTTADAFETTLTVVDPTADRTATLPDADTKLPIAAYHHTISGPTAARTFTTPDESFTIGYRNIPAVGTKTGSYTLAVGDVGKYVQLGSGGAITIPDATFAEGDVISLANNTTGNITITCTITTAYIAGTDSDKATMTLATRGVATIFFLSGTVCIVTGNVT